ncbi:argonaute 4A-like protein [Tanacetum coccineum]
MAYKTYESKMGGKGFAYDGGKALFTVGPLPMKKSEFTVILENLSSNRTVRGSLDGGDTKRSRRPPQGKQYTVKINYATKIPIQSIFNALQGQDSEQFNEAIRVLDVLLRQHAAKEYISSLNFDGYCDTFLEFHDLIMAQMENKDAEENFVATLVDVQVLDAAIQVVDSEIRVMDEVVDDPDT